MQVCHLGGWMRWREVLEELAGLDLYLETSFSLGEDCLPELREKILARHPKEYLVFGTDSPWLDQTEELAAFCRLPISEEAKRLALWDNAHRFAGITLD
jgi:predicted TIM-barrel fold metal-dependent hydrolase